MSGGDCRVDPNNWGQLDNRIAELANRQGGVVSRKQLIALGLSAKEIDYRVRIGRLRVIHRGIYAVGHDAIPVRGRLVAALLVAGPGSALSHRTAAHVLALLPSMPPFIEVTCTRRRPVNRPGLVFHKAGALPTTRRHGLPVTSPIRTLLDLAATRPAHEVERAASEALVLKLVTPRDMVTQHGPGSRALADLLVGPTRSGLERAFLKAVYAADLPPPLVNHPIGRYTVDFYWPDHRLVVETDGGPYHDHPLALRRDQRKTAVLRQSGLTVLRVRDAIEGVGATAAALSRPASRTAP